MDINSDLFIALQKEAHRIEEDALHSMKGHFNAGALWSKVHIGLGLPSAILAAWAGIEAFLNEPILTAILALLSATLSATVTFLNPEKLAEKHRAAGREYNTLRNKVRIFRSIDLLKQDENISSETIKELAEIKDSLNTMSPDIPRWAYEKALNDINQGRAEYKVDKENEK